MRKRTINRTIIAGTVLLLSMILVFALSSDYKNMIYNHKIKSTTTTSIITTTTSTTTTLPANPTGVTAEDMVAWKKVNICEMGGVWNYQGPIYSGGLGIRNSNWVAYGGLKYATNAGLASPEEQVAVAKKINSGYDVPDQNGCNGGW